MIGIQFTVLSAVLLSSATLWSQDCPHDTWVFGDTNAAINSSNYIPDNVEKTFQLAMMNGVTCTVRKTSFNKLPGPHGQGTEIYQKREVECVISKESSVLFDLLSQDTTNGISIVKDGIRDYVTLGYCK